MFSWMRSFYINGLICSIDNTETNTHTIIERLMQRAVCVCAKKGEWGQHNDVRETRFGLCREEGVICISIEKIRY